MGQSLTMHSTQPPMGVATEMSSLRDSILILESFAYVNDINECVASKSNNMLARLLRRVNRTYHHLAFFSLYINFLGHEHVDPSRIWWPLTLLVDAL
jgi:hypothetical protein